MWWMSICARCARLYLHLAAVQHKPGRPLKTTCWRAISAMLIPINRLRTMVTQKKEMNPKRVDLLVVLILLTVLSAACTNGSPEPTPRTLIPTSAPSQAPTAAIPSVETGSIAAPPFLDITARVGSKGNEQGLLGIALDPEYAANGTFYLNYTDLNRDTVVARFQRAADGVGGEPDSEPKLFTVGH